MPLTAEIIAVGTELLLGSIANTDAQDISRGLSELGINCYYHTTVGDNPSRLTEALRIASARSDIIITTGGLGPTYDDLTKQTVCEYFGLALKLHIPTWERIENYFKQIGRPLTDNNRQQAFLPENSVILQNDWGTAPGSAFAAEGKHVILLPGPPRECAPMFWKCAYPYLEKLSDCFFVSRSVKITGMGESQVESILRETMSTAKNPTIAPYAIGGEVLLRVTASAPSRKEAYHLTVPVVESLLGILGECVYGVDVPSLEHVVLSMLDERGLTLALAESCSGGLISERITAVPGASKSFLGCVCPYNSSLKTKLLGVPAELIEKYGAVSSRTALAMAEGICAVSGADIGLSVTGIAGPGGDGSSAALGDVYIALFDSAAKRSFCRYGNFGDERGRVRQMSAVNSLNLLRRYLLNSSGELFEYCGQEAFNQLEEKTAAPLQVASEGGDVGNE